MEEMSLVEDCHAAYAAGCLQFCLAKIKETWLWAVGCGLWAVSCGQKSKSSIHQAPLLINSGNINPVGGPA